MYKALHQTIRSSEKHAALSDYAERIWTRGLVAADMVGRLTANPKKFHVEAIPMLPYDEGKIIAAFKELEAVNLCHFYKVDGKPYMVFHEHDEHNKAARNLRNIKGSYPPPEPSVCPCVMYTKYEGEESTVVPTIVPTIVRTTASPILSSLVPDLVPEGVQGEPKPTQSSPEGLLTRLALDAKVIHASERQLRTHIAGWLADKGFQFCEGLLMNPAVRGKDVFWIHEQYFKTPKNGKSPPGLKKKVHDKSCLKCSGSGRRLNPATMSEMDCTCVKEIPYEARGSEVSKTPARLSISLPQSLSDHKRD